LTFDLISVSLEDLLEKWGRENVERLLKTFKCRLEPNMEEFLTQDAISFHQKHRSRTYLFLSKDRMTVSAYVTLGIKCMSIPKKNELSKKVRDQMNVHNGISQSYLIGQLCKADNVEKGIGPKLIEFALSIFNKSFKSVGCRVVRADCKADLLDFYRENGFHQVSQTKEADELYHMVMLL